MSTDKKNNAARPAASAPPAETSSPTEWIAYVQSKIENLKYGSLQIIVHDGRIMQVEATEKIRLPPPPRAP